MPRVKRGVIHNKKRKKILDQTKGFKWGRKNLIRLASTAATKAGANAFVGRKRKKRDFRALWQVKINSAVRPHGLSYSKFIKLLKENNIELDRKILANLAENHKPVFDSIVSQVKK